MARPKNKNNNELDSVYLLKLVVYVILGSLWFKVSNGENLEIGVPIGFMVGLVFAGHDHIQLDRKIGYAVLLIAMIMGFWLPLGLYVNL